MMPNAGSYLTILRIARRARLQLEMIVKAERPRRFNDDMTGLCGTSSLHLFNELQAAGFQPQIIVGMNHYFVVCDGWLVDITATQFKQAAVVVKDYAHVSRAIYDGSKETEWSFWKEVQRYSTPEGTGLKQLVPEMHRYFSY